MNEQLNENLTKEQMKETLGDLADYMAKTFPDWNASGQAVQIFMEHGRLQKQLATVTAERDVALEVLNKVEDAVTWLADDWRSVTWDDEAGYFYVSDLSKILAENDWQNNPGQLHLHAFLEAIEKSKAMQESEAGE